MIRQKIILFSLILILSSSLFASQLLPLHGRAYNNNTPISSGNLRVYIYDTPTGGNLVYDSQNDFLNSITGGYFDVMLGSGTQTLNLNYGQEYYLDLSINGTDIDFNGNERMRFEASHGTILSTAIADGTITNADISPTASIAWTKISKAGASLNNFIWDSDFNNNYLTTTNASNIYLTKTDANATYLPRAEAGDYVKQTDGNNWYARKAQNETITGLWSFNNSVVYQGGYSSNGATLAGGILQAQGLISKYDINSQRLCLTGDCIDSWDDVNQAINPAGANTQIQYNNNGSFGASPQFTWNNSTTTLGLSSGANYSTQINLNSGTRQAQIYMNQAGGFKITNNNTNLYISSGSTAESFYLQENGFGINTSSGVNETLHIKGKGTNSGVLLETGGTHDSYDLKNEAGIFRIWNKTDDINALQINNKIMALFPNNDGNVVINGTNAQALLTVGPTSETGALSVQGTGQGNIFTFRDVEGENIMKATGKISDNSLQLYFGDVDESYSKARMYLTTSKLYLLDANVGFGTNNPRERLEIYKGNILLDTGTTDGESKIKFYDDGSLMGYLGFINSIAGSGQSGMELHANNGSLGLSLNSNAVFFARENNRYIGLRTNNPQTVAHLYMNNNLQDNSALLLQQAGTGDVSLQFLTGSNYWSIGVDNSDNDKLKIFNGKPSSWNYPPLTITREGRIGIAERNPGAKLDLTGDLIVKNGDTRLLDINIDSAKIRMGDIEGSIDETYFVVDPSNAKFYFLNGDTAMGTSSPNDYRLYVQADASDHKGLYVNGLVKFSTDEFENAFIVENEAEGTVFQIDSDAYEIKLGPTGSYRVAIGDFGSNNVLKLVDIQKYSSASDSTYYPTLRIRNRSTSSNSFAGIELEGNNGNTSGFILMDGLGTGSQIAGTSRGLAVGTKSNHPLVLNTNNTERMRITESGNVGIGQPSSYASKLNVNGDIAKKGWIFLNTTSVTNVNYTGALTDIDFPNEVRKDTDYYTHSNSSNPDNITIKKAGWYRISYTINVRNDKSNRMVFRVRAYKNGTEIAGSRCYDYLRYYTYGRYGSCSATVIAHFNAGDVLDLRTDGQYSTGGFGSNCNYEIEAQSSLLVEKIDN